jgi:WhiB family transcriptional regulator, redox-sensing transcriptional regulator
MRVQVRAHRAALQESRWPAQLSDPWSGALCRQPGASPDDWFPVTVRPSDLAKYARRLCAGCPITAGCLRWALNVGEPEGIWGGQSMELLRRRGRAHAARNAGRRLSA